MQESLVIQRMEDVAIISLLGECSSEVVAELEKRCQEEILRSAKSILLDCQHISTLSPAALRCVLKKSTEAEQAGITLALYHLKPEHSTMIRNAGLESVLHIADSFSSAFLYCKTMSKAENPSSPSKA